MSYADNMILTEHNAEEVKAKAANGKPFKVDVTTNIGSARELSSKDEPGTLFFPYDANGTIIFNGDEMRAITKKDITTGPIIIDDNGNLNISANISAVADLGDRTKLVTGSAWTCDGQVKNGLFDILKSGDSVIDNGIYSFNYGYKIGSSVKTNNCMMMAFSTGSVVSQIVFSNSFGSTTKSPGIFMRTVDVGLASNANINWTKYPDTSGNDLAPTSW